MFVGRTLFIALKILKLVLMNWLCWLSVTSVEDVFCIANSQTSFDYLKCVLFFVLKLMNCVCWSVFLHQLHHWQMWFALKILKLGLIIQNVLVWHNFWKCWNYFSHYVFVNILKLVLIKCVCWSVFLHQLHHWQMCRWHQ